MYDGIFSHNQKDPSSLLIGILFLVLAFYKLKAFLKTPNKTLLQSIAVFIYFLKACNSLLQLHNPYRAYNIWLTAFDYSLQSIMIATFLILIDQPESVHVKITEVRKRKTKRVIDSIANYVINNKHSLIAVTFWNIILYMLIYLSRRSPEGIYMLTGKLTYLTFSCWTAAFKLNQVSSQLTKSMGAAQFKLDLLVVCVIMVGLLSLASLLLEMAFCRYIVTVWGSLYIFEVIAILIISEGQIPYEINYNLLGFPKDIESSK